jgi:hypothetical protein
MNRVGLNPLWWADNHSAGGSNLRITAPKENQRRDFEDFEVANLAMGPISHTAY